MTKKPIDMGRVRRSLARLDRLAEERPEAFDPDRLPTTAEDVGAAIERQETDEAKQPKRRNDGAPKGR